jgi:hypothetical protein
VHVRALFLLLLLANLLALAWSTWIVPPAPLAGVATPSARDRAAIQLLSESPAPPASASGGATNLSQDLAGVACVSAGPFLERGRADAAVAQLQRLGFTSRLRPSHEMVRNGYQVRVADLATSEDAANALATLKAAGLKDAYIVRDDTAANAVSIGAFDSASLASEAVGAARRAGFAAVASARTRAADVFWLDIDRQGNGGLPALDQLGAAPAEAEPPLQMRPCPASDAPAG